MASQTKPCENCGKPTTKTGSQSYHRSYWTCGQSCAGFLRVRLGHVAGKWQPNRFRGQRDTRPCAECGKEITRYVTEQNHDQPWHCSKGCTVIALNAQPRRRKGDEIACAICGKTFYRQPSAIRRGQRFCSQDCSHVAMQKGWTTKPCDHCGKEMSVRESQAGYRRFCSTDCTTLGKVKRPTGRMHNGKPVRKTNDGYLKVWEPDHPRSIRGWLWEHVLVMEKALGRPIVWPEEVDHKNSIRDDNREENLQVLQKGEHRKKTGADIRDARGQLAQLKAEMAELQAKLAALESSAS